MVAAEQKHLHNPIVCFGEGIRTILRVPVMLLVRLGLISENSGTSFSNSVFSKFLEAYLQSLVSSVRFSQ